MLNHHYNLHGQYSLVEHPILNPEIGELLTLGWCNRQTKILLQYLNFPPLSHMEQWSVYAKDAFLLQPKTNYFLSSKKLNVFCDLWQLSVKSEIITGLFSQDQEWDELAL